jgi:hypothetical protein
MFKKSFIAVLMLLIVVFSYTYSQSTAEKVKPSKKTVLLVRDSTQLEVTVAKVLRDTLSKMGYKVKEVGLSEVGKENASLFKVSIVFSAVVHPGDEINSDIDKFLSSRESKSSKIFLFNVSGTLHPRSGGKKLDKPVDATSQATESSNPKLIADHILYEIKL